ncbi:MAG: hypothetical protein NTZ39_09505 [Methanoregula sp.]|nr:hypothetical protein [Methanoregula sp.]
MHSVRRCRSGTCLTLGDSLEPLLMVRLLDQTATIGFVRLSQPKLAMNLIIDQQLHTVPMRLLIPMLNGSHRKAPLFVPAADVEPDAGVSLAISILDDWGCRMDS